MATLDKLESQLDEVFVKSAPELPKDIQKWIVTYAPYISLVGGALSLWSAYNLYRWATITERYLNDFSRAFGVESYADTSRLTVGIWLAVIVMAVQGALWIAAFPAIKENKKSGWNLMFYAVLVNAAYGLITLFTAYGSPGVLISYLAGTALGLYVLFQIRSHYLGKTKSVSPAPKPAEKSDKK